VSVALVAMCGAAALAGACADDVDVVPTTGDAGADGGTVDRATCPPLATPPADGTSCLLPEGTTCDFGECGRRLAQCTRGVWRYGANATSKPPCPADPPAEDTACPPCWPEELACTYGSTNCASEDASLNTAIASCPRARGTWQVVIRPCRDGGPDVQGDADAAAD